MITNFRHRLDALEREKKIAESKAHNNVMPYLETLTREEISDLDAWVFGDVPSWKPVRPDEYYAGLLYRAMNGDPMPQGYDWINGLCDGVHPKDSKQVEL